MILPGLPADGVTQWWTFLPQQDTTTSRGWHTWRKPVGISWIYIFEQFPGGGGGGGFTGAAGTARGGGAGGGSGGCGKLLIPAFLLPDVLYIRPGSGGAGGAASAAGTGGTQSFVSTSPNNSAGAFWLINSAAGAGSGGGAGSSTAGGTLGAAGSVVTASVLGASGIFLGLTGSAGTAGGAQTGAAGGTLSAPTGAVAFTTGGTGGGGTPIANTDFAGGPINSAGWYPAIAGGVAAAGAGNAGFGHNWHIDTYAFRQIPFITTGGTGGGTAGAAGTAGAGAPGGYGSGGGGGGGGVTGGAGGKGGDGFILIGAF